jgi:4-aminobutyrate aminotransferase
MHSNTFGGHALACIAALKTIEVAESLLHRVVELEKVFIEKLSPLREKYEKVGDVRGIGLAWGVEFVVDKKSKRPDPITRNKVVKTALENGLVLTTMWKELCEVNTTAHYNRGGGENRAGDIREIY